jgi:hypothetical protein
MRIISPSWGPLPGGLALLLCLATTSCRWLAEPLAGARPAWVLAFWDATSSIVPGETEGWKSWLIGLVAQRGDSLWEREQFDSILVQPLHARSASAAALFGQRFSGSEFARALRRQQRARFAAHVSTLDSLHFDTAATRHTDVLGSIDRAVAFFRGDTTSRHEVWYLSDMRQDTGGAADLVGPRAPRTRATAAMLAGRVAREHAWGDQTLAGVVIRVHVPGSVSGTSTPPNAAPPAVVEAFWRVLFERLGARVVSWGP